MSERVIIDKRFNGQPEFGNGGYVCGAVARLIGGPAEVTLRRPPPVGRPLEIRRLQGRSVQLLEGETVVADGIPATIEVEVPEAVNFEDAKIAARSYPGLEGHLNPACFGCGTHRAEGDGLRIFSGPVAARNIVAAPWIPDSSLFDEYGNVRTEFLWTALDCPSGWAVITFLNQPRNILLGRLGARMIGAVRRNERCVVIGWPIAAEGRKLFAGSAVFSATGDVRAIARAIWIKSA